jgi:FAD/FMN-containing dehydrogenase
MEASVTEGQTMGKAMLKELQALVGAENVAEGPESSSGFLRVGSQAPEWIRVSPATTEEVQAVVNLARARKVGIVTCTNRYALAEDLEREGILIDFSRLNKVERIDTRNLVAHIERGVTWDQLNAELMPLGVKTYAPVAANSSSVVETIVARGVGKGIAKHPDYPLMNMKVVLADGDVLKTGTHGFNEEAADGRNEGGPNLSQWHVGGDDVFGVVTRATIMLWPVCESRSCLVYGFEEIEEVLNALKQIPRTELGVEYVAINRASLQRLLGEEEDALPAWSLIVGFEGREKLVSHNEDRVGRLLEKYDCSRNDALVPAMTERLDEPWMEASDNHTAFFTRFDRAMELNEKVQGAAEEAGVGRADVGKILVSVDRGRAVYAAYDWFCEEDCAEALEAANLSIADEGAFFDRPHGSLGRKIYTSIPNHLPVLKHIKGFLDPENVLNPGRILKEEDKAWEPPKVPEGEIGLTVGNLKEVMGKLRECVGEDWVSDNPVDLINHGRDFTVFSGERPNIVILPESKEQIQQIMRIAYEHGIPVVPQTTGFNHGGLTISRKGGILVDLRRMDKVCHVDDEAMTVTVSPAVRMRYVWWEAVKYRATEGVHLKPVLPLTLASVSLLSNYVARGAPGTAAKHGNATEMTVKMTWVLPNGEVFELGPEAIPGVGNLPIQYCPGPEINGMFFNADGQFGICTELTTKLYPEYDNVVELEEMLTGMGFETDGHKGFCKIIDTIYDVSRENITEFMYKGHPGGFALAMNFNMDGVSIKDALDMAPRHPLALMVSGYDAEEIGIKKEILKEILERHGLIIVDPNMFGQDLADMMSTDPMKMSLGIRDNFAGTYKGAFQWTAAQVKMDLLPEIALEYEKLVEKYWKTSDPTISVEHAMTDTAVQGPLPYGRCGPCEFDYWWDQGNPEEVKRATVMIHKTNKLLLKHGGSLWRNMFGAGEYHLPMWGKYFEILKQTKAAFDPANLMHPDVLPLTDDYV